jgi:hypothetical protein
MPDELTGQVPVIDTTPLTPVTVTSSVSAPSICLYGDSRTGKTNELGRIAEWIWKKYRKPSRLITAEPGNLAPIMPHIESGMIDVLPINETVRDIASMITALQKGAWMPLKEISQANGKVVTKLTPAKENGLTDRKIGAYFVEGLSSISERLIRNLAQKNVKIGQDAVGVFTEASLIEGEDLVRYGSPSMSHFGWVQGYMADLIATFTNLPVELVVFLSHEAKGDEVLTATPVYGPGIVGKKANANLPWKLGDMFHLDMVNTSPAGKAPVMARLLYLFDHPDSSNGSIIWKASPRLTVSQQAQVKVRWPKGCIDLERESVTDYLDFRQTLASNEAEALRKLMSIGNL